MAGHSTGGTALLRSLAGLLVLLCLAVPHAALAEGRVALVIGNAAYRNATPLRNTIADSEAVAAALTRLGFAVTLRTDLGKAALETALADFADHATGAEQAVLFYAGHGMELDGENYLIPTDARLTTDRRIGFETVGLTDILASITDVKGLRLVLLDACRNNPFAATMKPSRAERSIGRGLARVEPKPGMLVSYAAAAGTTADDGDADSGHSPYTEALLHYLETPGLEVNLMFRQIADRVQERTKGRQTPFEYGRLPGVSIYLKPPVAESAVTPADPCGDAALHWQAISGENDAALYREHLQRFPTCAFAGIAARRLAALEAGTPVVAETATPPETALALTDKAAGDAAKAGEIAEQAATDAAGKASEVAAITPAPEAGLALPVTVPAEPLVNTTLIRDVQERLRGAGCLMARADGHWGPQSEAALAAYRKQRALPAGAETPSEALLAALASVPGRVCPLVCGVGERERNGVCVARTCPAGRVLSAAGICIRERTKTVIQQRQTTPVRKVIEKTRPVVVEQKTETVQEKPKKVLRRCQSVREAELHLDCRPL
ncbi:caspase family protein [Rhizobium sp. SG2393]|uniref:caspase family protein n=1 Tax=Rhizobium sp. SG2393 TaxID=3276279 RepID=UPI00367238EE